MGLSETVPTGVLSVDWLKVWYQQKRYMHEMVFGEQIAWPLHCPVLIAREALTVPLHSSQLPAH